MKTGQSALVVSMPFWLHLRNEVERRSGSATEKVVELRAGGVMFRFDSGQVVVSRSRGPTLPHDLRSEDLVFELAELGVREILTTAVCGSLKSSLAVPSLLVLDQFIDMHRLPGLASAAFAEMTDPYCPRLRGKLLLACARSSRVPFESHGCYVGVDGPRYETRAEVRAFERLGGDVVGMTAVREAIAARANQLCIGTLAVAVNAGAGIGREPVRNDAIRQQAERLASMVCEVMTQAAVSNSQDSCELCD